MPSLADALTPEEDIDDLLYHPGDRPEDEPAPIPVDNESVYGATLEPASDTVEPTPIPQSYEPANVLTPSQEGAKFVKWNPDGSAQFSNGVRSYPDGHIQWDEGDRTYAQRSPYLKPVVVATRAKQKSQEAIADEAAARKGVVRSAYPEGPEGDAVYRKDRSAALNPSGGVDDVSMSIAEAIISGNQPPDLKGMYRHGPGIRKALQDKGYSLTDAVLDWKATERHMSSLEGPQQLRMRQAIDNAYHSLDVIEDLSNQWDAGQFPVLNKVRLESAKQGALGPEAQKIAVQLEAQISDVTSELGNVYMGGNSPTDHSLTLAAKNLSENWSRETLKAALQQARKNLVIRDNSIKSVGTSRTDNRYDQQPKPEAAVTPTPSPAPVKPVDPDAVAEQWLLAHPNDPRAPGVRARLEARRKSH